MDLKIAARMIAVFALGAGLTAAIAALQSENGSGEAPALSLRDPGGEPVPARRELSRCRDMGVTALDDTTCRKAWAENRRRFFVGERPERPAMPKPERFGELPSAEAATVAPVDPTDAKKAEDRLRPDTKPDADAADDSKALAP